MNFKEKVQSMTAKEIIMAMVEGLKNPWTDKIDMTTFGHSEEGVCYGCAATNTICQIKGEKFTPFALDNTDRRAEFFGVDWFFLVHFESAIDYLRRGNIEEYNLHAEEEKFATIKNPLGIKLRKLDNMTYDCYLSDYTALAESQE